MPIYEFRCPECKVESERVLPIRDFGEPQMCECGATLEHLISANVGMVLKGDGWPGKAMRVKGQMGRKNQRISQRSQERAADGAPDGTHMKLVPNVGGEEVESWSEAQSMAASKGKDASSYEPLVQKEKG